MRKLPVMSRHAFEQDGSHWVLGWDEPTVTYFAQRENAAQDLDDVTGTTVGQHTHMGSLLNELDGQVTVPDDVRTQLEREAPTFTAAAVVRAESRVDELAAEMHRAGRSQPQLVDPPATEIQR
jgi:hypothetical protein